VGIDLGVGFFILVAAVCMQANKTLLVPTPRLRTGLFNKIMPPEDANKEILRKCSTALVGLHPAARVHGTVQGVVWHARVHGTVLGVVWCARVHGTAICSGACGMIRFVGIGWS